MPFLNIAGRPSLGLNPPPVTAASAVVLLDGVWQPARSPFSVFFARTDLLDGMTWQVDSVSVGGVTVTHLPGGVYTIQVDPGVAPGVYSFSWSSDAPAPSSGVKSFSVS